MKPNHHRSDRSLSIGFIAPGFAEYDENPTSVGLCKIARLLHLRGHRVTILAPAVRGAMEATMDGIALVRFRYAPAWMESIRDDRRSGTRRGGPLTWLTHRRLVNRGVQAAKWMARVDPLDVVHVLSPALLGPIGRAAAELCHAPLITSVDHYTLHTAGRRLQRSLRETLAQSDTVIADSSETRCQLDQDFSVAAELIPPGTHFVPQACATPRNSVPRILYTGKLLPHKGLEYLLRAVPFLLAERRVKLIIAGDGEHARALRTLAHLLHIQDHVEFLGYVSTERLHEEYSRCDVWVNPSVADDPNGMRDLSSGALEAYTYRRPVVATNVGYSADIVQHGRTGWLVEERDEFALFRALQDLLQQPGRARMFGEAGFRHILENFSWDSICERQEAVYRHAVDRRLAGHVSRRGARPVLRLVRSEAA